MKKTQHENTPRADVDRTVKLTWKDISEADLRAALVSAKSGSDPVASMKLIEYFYRRIHDNLPHDQTILFEFLDHVFGKIVDGQQPDHVLGFKQDAGTK